MAEDKFYGSMIDGPRENTPPAIDYAASEESEKKNTEAAPKVFGRTLTLAINETLAPTKSAKTSKPDIKADNKDDKNLIQRIMSAYNSAEQRDAFESARNGIQRTLSSSLWQRITSNDYAIAEADKQAYISTVSSQIESMKQNRVKLQETNDHLGGDLEQVSSRLGTALEERNGLRQEYRELKAEYEKTVNDILTVKTNLEGCTDDLKRGEFEMQLHELKTAGGRLEEQLSEDNSKIEQYAVLIKGFKEARNVLSAQKKRVSGELRWISTAVVGMDQTKKVLEYFFENQTGEIGLGLESEKRKEEIRQLQSSMNNLMGLYHNADSLSQEISKEESLRFVEKQRTINPQGFFVPDEIRDIARSKLGVSSVMEID